jgi:mono/diheme cytochrome c family protein
MRIPSYRLKCNLLAAVVLILTALVCVNESATQKRSGLTPQEKRGKLIYVKGDSAAGEITAILGNSALEVPASSFSCANCHGLRGEGTREGGIEPPPINWERLTQPHTSALTRRERGAYNEATLARAVSDALDPAGARLHPAMPNYRMTREQMADLIAYLKQLGNESDTEPGVDDETIRLGAVLPLSGTRAGRPGC